MPSRLLGELAGIVGGEVVGDATVAVTDVAELSRAGASHIAPLTDPRRLDEGHRSPARAFLVRTALQVERPQLVCEDTSRALALIIDELRPRAVVAAPGVHPRAVVCDGVTLDAGASVGALAYVGSGARIGADAQLLELSYVGAGVAIGARCVVGPSAVVLPGSRLDDGVRVGPGAVVGHDGFGYYRDASGWSQVRCVGGVHIERDVELGANTCVDRGTLGDTRVGAGTKIDNLVQIGHNVDVGARSLLCGQSGVAGSARLGDDVMLAGQAGVSDHRDVGARVRVGAGSRVLRDLEADGAYTGYPAIRHTRWLRLTALLSRLLARGGRD